MGNKPWRASNAKRMTFDEMAACAQYEWDRAEKAEAEAEHYERECSSLRTRAESAEARVAELEKAIEPFAAAASAWQLHADDELLVEPFPGVDCDLLVSDLRAAQAAIGGKK